MFAAGPDCRPAAITPHIALIIPYVAFSPGSSIEADIPIHISQIARPTLRADRGSMGNVGSATKSIQDLASPLPEAQGADVHDGKRYRPCHKLSTPATPERPLECASKFRSGHAMAGVCVTWHHCCCSCTGTWILALGAIPNCASSPHVLASSQCKLSSLRTTGCSARVS